jgi:hypothetical protein
MTESKAGGKDPSAEIWAADQKHTTEVMTDLDHALGVVMAGMRHMMVPSSAKDLGERATFTLEHVKKARVLLDEVERIASPFLKQPS